MKVWALTEEFKEGKYLVVRRDGTVPTWPHFVLSARDPAAPEALRSYAVRVAALGLDRDYRDSIWDLARMFEDYGRAHSAGDPDAAPHRVDNSFVIACMRHQADLTGIGQAPAGRPDIEYRAALSKVIDLLTKFQVSKEFDAAGIDTITTFRMILQVAQDALRAPEPVQTVRAEPEPPARPESGLSV